MLSVREIYIVLVLVQLASSSALFAYVWSRRRVSGALPLLVLLATELGWMLGIGATCLSASETLAHRWFQLRTLSLFCLAPALIGVVNVYVGHVPTMAGRLVPWLLPVSTTTLALFGRFGLDEVAFRRGEGLQIWYHASQGVIQLSLSICWFGLMLLALGRLAGYGLRARGPRRRASLLVAVGVSLPIVIGFARLVSRSPLVTTLALPPAMTFMTLTLALAVLRYRWLDISPLARGLLDVVPDPIFVQGADHRFLLANRAFCAWVGRRSEREVVGQIEEALFPPPLAEHWRRVGEEARQGTPAVPSSHEELGDTVMRTHHAVWPDRGGEPLLVGVMRDVTEIERARAELATRAETLQATLAEVQTLQGFVPICTYCKKIRDDRNFWTRLEEYVSAQTGASFSHGICPDCYKRALSEYGIEEDRDSTQRD